MRPLTTWQFRYNMEGSCRPRWRCLRQPLTIWQLRYNVEPREGSFLMRKWTWAEFESVLEHPHLSDEDVAVLVKRSPGAVDTIREAVHSYHLGTKFWQTALNKDIKQRLQEKRKLYTCPVCGVIF